MIFLLSSVINSFKVREERERVGYRGGGKGGGCMQKRVTRKERVHGELNPVLGRFCTCSPGCCLSTPCTEGGAVSRRVPARVCFLLRFGVKTILSQRTSRTAASRHEQPQGKAVASPRADGAEQPVLDMLKGTWP